MYRYRIVIVFLFVFTGMSPLPAANITVKGDTPVQLYGFVKFETFWDNTEIAKGDWLLYNYPAGGPEANRSIFSMNARHTRLGLRFGETTLVNGKHVTGLIEIDFAGGFPNSTTAARQPNPRLRHAWVEVSSENHQLRLGQDWALIAGPFPKTTSFVVGAGKGHLWNRFAQIRTSWKRSTLKVALSLNRPMAGNIKYEDYAGGDFDIVGDGERSGLPWIMGRVWFSPTTFINTSLGFHAGQEVIDDLSGTEHTLPTFSVNLDGSLAMGNISLYAKGFYGENLNTFFGGVFQGFATDSTSVTNIPVIGGWGQAVWKMNDQWSTTLGLGIDNPDDSQLTEGMRAANHWGFGNVVYNPSSALKYMLECEYLATKYIHEQEGDNIRIQFVTYYLF